MRNYVYGTKTSRKRGRTCTVPAPTKERRASGAGELRTLALCLRADVIWEGSAGSAFRLFDFPVLMHSSGAA